ncbi:9649_t:CDS:2 [Paraglomus occultum]|uniref:9649_t:CDS:1 n=1 Tax=Paraglomus occultum TaxID=144539 RepID=A0A9N9CKS2_9GLOM|nr:9649_t:CDS:2 [Paraglomus occultum]
MVESTATQTLKKKPRYNRPTILVPSTERTFLLSSNKEFNIQYSIHSIASSRYARDLKSVFPEVKDLDKCLVVPTFQKCVNDLAAFGEVVDKERDEKLENFIEWGKAICEYLKARGHWADLVDPASAYPMYSSPGPSGYPEVVGAEQLLKYHSQNANCCKILLHPQWGSKVYPATLFTTSDEDTLKQAIDTMAVIDA